MNTENTQTSVKRRILDYLGSTELTEDNVQLCADPYCDGVWAVRVTADFYLPDFLHHADGDIEECEFKSWPPKVLY